jgi:LAO/AO transport system kinase
MRSAKFELQIRILVFSNTQFLTALFILGFIYCTFTQFCYFDGKMNLAQKILEGDLLAASKLMRDIDDQMPGALESLKELYPKTGKAYIIGITGPPGSGKSTLVDKMVDFFRKEGKSVGVVAVDPSSPFTGGAILGDRIRMQRHATDEGVFIRSLATRGDLGGLSRSTQDVINVMDAMGKEIILVETVGVGQDEVDIVNTAHTSIVVLVPGMGDDKQSIKAGIIEIGDIFVINKSDREGADKTERDLRMALGMGKKREDGWEPLVFKTEASAGKGIFELVSGIDRHKQALAQNQALEKKLSERARTILLEVLESKVMTRFVKKIEKEGEWDHIIDDLAHRRTDPYSVAEKMIAEELKDR